MNNKLPLKNDIIVLTGTSITKVAQSRIEELGGEAIHLPLIETVAINSPDDLLYLQQSQQVDWLIFTSQNAVYAFTEKMHRFNLTANEWRNRIAVVGKKTADSLMEVGFDIDFMPTVYSADYMVKEFNPLLGEQTNCLFIRGSMAKNTIIDGLSCQVKTWTIYETVQTTAHIEEFQKILQQKRCTIVFASPSAVDVYKRFILPDISWESVNIAAIGHITEHALLDAGADSIIQPAEYTMTAVIEEIAKRKEL